MTDTTPKPEEVLENPQQAPLLDGQPVQRRELVSQLVSRARGQPEQNLIATLQYLDRLEKDVRRGALIRLFGLTGGQAPEELLQVAGESSHADQIQQTLRELGEWLEEGQTVPDFGQLEQEQNWMEAFERAVRKRRRLVAAQQSS